MDLIESRNHPESSWQTASKSGGRQTTAKQVITDNPTMEISLTVGCYCERGKHRSVAFVEELGRKPWPKEWVVETVHRDVEVQMDKHRSQNHKHHRKRKEAAFLEQDTD